MSTRTTLRLSAAAGIVGLVTLGAAATPATHAASKPTWVTYDAKSKTAKVTVIASYANPNSFDFNGYMKGKLTITVPLGTKVVATFTNKSTTAHSVEFINFAATPPVTAPKPAFAGAASPNYTQGVATGSKPETITFTANKAGKYLMICAVPGHALAGMWDLFVVDAHAKMASVSVSK